MFNKVFLEKAINEIARTTEISFDKIFNFRLLISILISIGENIIGEKMQPIHDLEKDLKRKLQRKEISLKWGRFRYYKLVMDNQKETKFIKTKLINSNLGAKVHIL